MIRALLIFVLWFSSVAVAYWAGWHMGSSETDTPELKQSGLAPEPAPQQVATNTKVSPTPMDELNELIAAGRLFPAIELIKEIVATDASNISLRFTLAELLTNTGQVRAAIAELLAIRSLSLDSADLAEARRRIDQIAATAHAEFEKNRRVPAALNFFSDLQALEPSYDRHRWYLIQWMIKNDDFQAAQRLLNETGVQGITAAELDEVKQQLAKQSTTITVRRESGALFTDVFASSSHNVLRLNMLLDTGATVTAVSLDKLRELGARRTPHIANVQTANGTVTLPIYELEQLEAGPLTLNNLSVVALTDPLPHADGLLGFDVLDQLPSPIPVDEN